MVRFGGGCLWLLMVLCGPAMASEPWAERLWLRSGESQRGLSRDVYPDGLCWEQPDGRTRIVPWGEIERLEIDSPATRFLGETGDFDPDVGPSRHLPWDPIPPERDLWVSRVPQVWDEFSTGVADWTKRVGLGGRMVAGNARSRSAEVSAEFERRIDTRFTQLLIQGQYAEANHVRGANRWTTNTSTDFFQSAGWLYFIKGLGEYDQFQNLDFRGTLSAGPGYRFFDEPKRRAFVRVGPGVTYENFQRPSIYRTTPDLYHELEVRWPLADRVQMEQRLILRWALDTSESHRLTDVANLVFALDAQERWNLKLGMQYQFLNRPNAGRSPHDYWTTLSIVYQRK